MSDTGLSASSAKPAWKAQLGLDQRLLNALFCVAFYLIYEAFYRYVAIFNDGGMYAVYDPHIMSAWRGWLIVAAAIPAFFTSDRYKPSHVFCAILYFMVYIPILVAVPNHLPNVTAIYLVLQILAGMSVISYLSGFEIKLELDGQKIAFWAILSISSAFCLFLMAKQAISAGVTITGIEDNSSLREEMQMQPATAYAVNLWGSALGPLWLGLFLFKKRYVLFALVSLSFLLLYGIAFQKFMLFTPIWVLAFYLLCQIFRSAKFTVLLVATAIPIAIAIVSQFTPLAYFGSGYIGFRMYGIHGTIFVHYFDFFQKNPYTWFSHIKGISWFIHYPYNEVLPLLIGAAYPGGNQNANFWAMDALAGAGENAIVFVSAAFGLIMIALNTAARWLPARFVIPSLSVVALHFADGPIGTNFLTGGLGLLMVLVFLMPRSLTTNGLPARASA